ncbi:hypothetical protein FDECE_13418 [Fusarium decemcellulare]|nr:hypothetical protein FDECE_13418 [Fusarium decemcellulare]
MASVYQRAILVIAAADANDSTDGLFLAKRLKPQTFRLPIPTPDGHATEIWHVAEVPHEITTSGIRGPLRERGWALQEWYLGRRIVFFTSEGIKWKCKKEEMNERGNENMLRLYENDNWMSCLEIYSQKQLTVPSDRMPALLGIVSQLRKTRNDSFREDVGTWEDELAEQLLWRQLDEPRDQLELPSWCWAAAAGKKLWMFKLPHLGRLRASFHGIAQTVKLSQSQSVNASGYLMPVTIGPQRLEKCCIENLWRASSIQTGSMLRDWTGVPESDQITRFPVCDLSEEHAVLGLAVLDIGSSRSECFCFVLGLKTTTGHK